MLGPIGVPWRPRILLVTVATTLVALVVLAGGIAAGSAGLSIPDVLAALAGAGDQATSFIVGELRLPRAAAGAAVGACLGLAGALTQTFSRNPLATPDILGVTSGAAAGAVAAIVLGGGGYSVGASLLGFGIPVVATVGGLAAAALVYGLAWRGGVDSYRIILIGIGLTASLGGLTSYLLVRAQLTQAGAASQWLVGSLSGISWTSVWPMLVVLGLAIPVLVSQSSGLALSPLGDEFSTSLGLALQRHRLIVIATAVLLTSAAVAAAGPIEFVAFVAPQLAQRLAGTARPPLVASAVSGAALVLAADVLARILLPGEIPVGIITAVIGAPYLIWLLIQRKDVR
ncbi:iron complex transport system permease protein [Propionicimonas paludicola]|uniref:Iron complex transport system permease protein n=2 Tax=Propionicimonas paludicola TaxID=185243 RepID=A0A2A9CPK2_9ACTN|nr:iron complex transport system permease protein [Propionicimonas paludicola]